jgi:hypothetical protein
MLSCNRCKEECDDASNPECPNYVAPVDPCSGLSPVSADFTISARASSAGAGYHKIIEIDGKVYSNKLVILHALEEGASYKWVLGLDTIYDQSYEFTFPDNFIGQTIPIKLIVTKTPNSACFPQDNGMDTLIQYMQVIDGCDASYQGVYYGAWDDAPLDSFYMSFTKKDDLQTSIIDCSDLWARGVNGDFNDSCKTDVIAGTDNYLWIGEDDWCPINEGVNDPFGEFFFDHSNGTVHAEYELTYQINAGVYEHPQKIFKGRKIN